MDPSDRAQGLTIERQPVALINLSVLHAPREMGPVIERALESGWKIYLVAGTHGIADSIERWCQQGATRIDPPMPYVYGASPVEAADREAPRAPAPSRPRNQWRQKIVALAPPSLRALLSLVAQWRFMRRARTVASAIFRQADPDVFISNNFHSCGRLDNALLDESRRKAVVSACIAVSPLVAKVIARPGRLVQYHSGMYADEQKVSHSLFSRIIAALHPEWTVADGSACIFMWPPAAMLASRLAGLLPADVWQTPHPDFDLIFAQHARAAELLRESGVPEEKIRVHGPPRMDEVIRSLAQPAWLAKFYGDHRLRLGEPYILWNVEPSWEHHYCTAELHWQRVRQLAVRLRVLSRPIVVSLHPLCSRADYEFLEGEFGFRISDYGIHHVYPGCEFAVSFACSTNYYAVMLRKRILMYDWFGVCTDARRWNLYRQEGLEAVQDFEQLEDGLARFVSQHSWDGSVMNVTGFELASPRIFGDIGGLVATRRRAHAPATA
jgi:hypothetical protein